jgi:hypothetical protein
VEECDSVTDHYPETCACCGAERGTFREAIGVETIYPKQLKLVRLARETVSVRAHLLSLLDNLSTENLSEVRDFAEFLSQKQQQASTSAQKSEIKM